LQLLLLMLREPNCLVLDEPTTKCTTTQEATATGADQHFSTLRPFRPPLVSTAPLAPCQHFSTLRAFERPSLVSFSYSDLTLPRTWNLEDLAEVLRAAVKRRAD
jgi:hypothetical protein